MMFQDDQWNDLEDEAGIESEDSDGQAEALKNYITPIGLKKIKDEYHELFHVERPKLVEVISWAASNGDRSENGDYIYGKRRLREIDRRLKFLGKRLAAAIVVDPATQSGDKILFGASVTVEDEEGKTLIYHIVGEDEINIEERKISWVSPIAKSLLGAKKGDVVLVHRPTGETELVIKKVEYSKIKA